MKIVIVSDTHGDITALRRVAMIEYDSDLFLHAGDVQAAPAEISPFVAVKGNCDGAFPDYPFRYETATPFGLLHMEHYPIFGSAMYQAFYQDGIRIFIHGHTHEKEEDTVSGIRVYCPGSLCYPHDSDQGTYLVLTVTKDKVDGVFKTITI